LASSLSTTRPLRARRHVIGRWPSVWAVGFFLVRCKIDTSMCNICHIFNTSIKFFRLLDE
jgi:hypothetical protein